MLKTCVFCGHESDHNPEESYNCSNCGIFLRSRQGLPRTQKGKGLVALSLSNYLTMRVRGIVQDLSQVPTENYPFFARPAPSHPRHGYIDSRVVDGPEGLRELIGQVLDDDPEGEVILCEWDNPRYNGVWTPSSFTVGVGHDGATSGKNTVVLPLSGKIPLSSAILEAGGIRLSKWPYIEVVSGGLHSQSYLLTQLREGPKMPNALAGNYVPSNVEVKRVIKADPKVFQDLGWEKEIENAEGEPGVVVWHPGGSMTDHFSIHAFTAKIPIIFDADAPEVGSTISPTDAVLTYDPRTMLCGVVAGEKVKIDPNGSDLDEITGRRAIELVLICLHNASVMTGEYSKWIGMAAAIMLRLGSVALRGEVRHFGGKSSKKARSLIYDINIKRSLSGHRAGVNRLINIFRYGTWSGAGFGGMKWACCGAATVGLFNAVRDLALLQTEEAATKVVRQLNLAVNQAHNGGWWLNKFYSDDYKAAARGCLNPICKSMGVIYKMGNTYRKLPPKYLERRIDQIGKWPDTTLAPPRVRSVSITYQVAVGAMKLKIKSKLLGDKFVGVRFKIKDPGKEGIAAIRKRAYLVEGNDGYTLEVRGETEGEASKVLWKDESLKERADLVQVSY